MCTAGPCPRWAPEDMLVKTYIEHELEMLLRLRGVHLLRQAILLVVLHTEQSVLCEQRPGGDDGSDGSGGKQGQTTTTTTTTRASINRAPNKSIN